MVSRNVSIKSTAAAGFSAGIVFAIAGAAQADYTSEVLSQTPLFYWNFNETEAGSVASLVDNSDIADPTATASAGVLFGQTSGPSLSPAGGFDGFGGGNSWFNFPAVTAGDFVNNLATPSAVLDNEAGSVSYWLRTDSVTGEPFGRLLVADQGATGGVYTFIDDSGRLGFRSYNGNGEALALADVRSSTSYTDGQWHHFVATWDESVNTAALYINGGAAAGGETVTGNLIQAVDPFVSSNRLRFAKGANNASRYLGDADELAIWDIALTEAQARAQYDAAFTAIVEGLNGDYNDSGSVEQGDLDLVLNNWGGPRTAGFVANADGFATGNVDQEELDRVLNNWGSSNAPAFNDVSVPEPASAFALLGGLALVARRRHII